VLHEINSEESTVSLENVKSFGTEGRRGNPSEELPASDQIYEYIVFRGSDVKDLRIEQPAPAKENKPPTMPDDPAIVGVSVPSLPLRSCGRPARDICPRASHDEIFRM
jgi:protein LSM14